jgi:uncharacterized protein (DUF58 family)
MRLVREVLAADEARGGTDNAGALDFLNSVMRRKAVVFLVSDFQDAGWEKRLATTAIHHDLVCCHLSDPCERQLPDAGVLELEDPETGEALWVDTSSKALREAYAAQAAARLEGLKTTFRRNRVDAMFLSTDQDPIHDVRAFFRNRAAKRRRAVS